MARQIMGRSGSGRGGRSSGGTFKDGRRAVNKPTPPAPPAPTRRAVNRPTSTSPQQNYSSGSPFSGSPYGGSPGGGDFGGGIMGGGGAPSEEDYLAGDATYQATISALKKQLESFTTDIGTQRSNRKLDYDKAIKDLGYIAPGEGGEASWNFEDPLTASGRSYQNQLNDFAARGGLRSSGYADALNNLTRSLMDQYTGIDQSNTQFNSDLDRQLTKAKDENTAASQAARAEAIMRRAAQYGFGV